MHPNHSLRNFSFVTAGRISNVSLLGVFYFIFASFLEPEIYGEMSFYIAIGGAASMISRFGLPLTVTVYRAKENHILSNQANFIAFLSGIGASLILIPIEITSALLCFSTTVFIMNLHNLLGFKRYKDFFLMSTIKGILAIGVSLGLYFIVGMPGVLIGLAISNVVSGIHLFKSIDFKIKSLNELKKNFKVLPNNFGVELSSGLTHWMDKLIIVPLFGFLLVGLYQFNLQILYALTLFPTALFSFLLTEKSSGFSHIRISYFAILTSIILVILVIFLSPFVVEQLFPKFVEGIPALQILIIALIPITLTSILNAELQSKESTKIGYTVLVKFGAMLVLIWSLGELYGIVGLSIAIVISTCVETAFLYFLHIKYSD